MGYQESIIPVDNLASVAGIDKAVREAEELKVLEYLDCICAARAKRDLYRGYWFGRPLSDVKDGEVPEAKKGDLFAVVAGARLYQPFWWTDCIAGIDELGYSGLLEDIPLEEAYKESALNPDDAWKMECFMRRSLSESYELAVGARRPIKLPDKYASQEPEESFPFEDIPF